MRPPWGDSGAMRTLLFSTLLRAGCYRAHDPFAIPFDGAPPPRRDGGTSETVVAFVISSLDIPQAADRVVGFDLDGEVSDGLGGACTDQPDLVSAIDGERGVDNALESLVPSIRMVTGLGPIAPHLEGAIADGAFAIGLLVHADASGRAVQVELVRAVLDTPIRVDARGRILGGQTMRGVVTQSAGASARGARTRARFERLPLPVPPELLPLFPLRNLRNAILAFELRGTGLIQGTVGARLSVEDVVADAAIYAPGNEAVVRSVMESIADLEPTADGRCAAVSVGLSFEAVPAVWTE